MSYERLFKLRELRSGTYIFVDIEHLPSKTAERAAKYWRELENSGLPVRLYNHPLKVMRRFELLRNLHDKNYQRWNVYHITDLRWPSRYPVFLRRENNHDGPITGLISNRRELEQEIKLLVENGYCREDIIITEFCDTKGSDGYYKKFGALLIGGRIIRRHIFFNKTWMIKLPPTREELSLQGENSLQEEMDYIQSKSHEEAILKTFNLARIDYGRIDYGMLNGQMQVWEINTLPRLITRVEDTRAQVHKYFLKEYLKALEEIDLPSQPTFKPRVHRQPKSFFGKLLKRIGKLIRSI